MTDHPAVAAVFADAVAPRERLAELDLRLWFNRQEQRRLLREETALLDERRALQLGMLAAVADAAALRKTVRQAERLPRERRDR